MKQKQCLPKEDLKRRFLPWTFALIIISITACLFMAGSVTAGDAPPVETISGNLADGTPYTVHKPASWNGTIILDLDGASVRPARLSWMTANGYAIGGTSRNIAGYNFKQAVNNLVTVRGIFAEKFGMPTRTLTTGGSRGGFVSRLAMEFEPDIFDGALLTAGGGAGEIASFNMRLDTVWAFKQLVNPDAPLKLVNITDVPAANAALEELVKTADATPQGKARLILAAAFEQYPSWAARNTSEPAPDDYDALYAQVRSGFVFANPAVVRAGVEAVAGGNVFWNNGIDYSDQLHRSGKMKFVKAMYKKAGLDLAADLKTLADAPRISADPDALRVAEPLMTYTGEVNGPIMNVDNTGDPVDPTPCETAYEDTLKRAGNGKFLRNAFVHAPGHGGCNPLELITGFVALINRLDTGKWGETDPNAMNKLAADIAAKSPDIFKDMSARFIKFTPDKPLRTWDVRDWNTYRP